VGDPLETLKAELERFGEANDAATNERPRRMLNITRDTGNYWRCSCALPPRGGCWRSARPTVTPPSG